MLQIGVIILVMLLISVVLILVVIMKRLSESKESKKRLMKRLDERNQENNDLHRQIIRDQVEKIELEKNLTSDAVQYFEEELQHMGAEIHDDLIQRLTEHRFTVEKLSLTDNLAELQAMGLRLKGEFKTIVLAVRRISKRLLPDNLVEGSFTSSIRGLCQQLETTKLIIHFEGTGKEAFIQPDHALQLYRIVQELIHNTSKHSLAWHLWVRVDWTNGLQIQLEDDGLVDNMDQTIRNLSSFRTLRLRALKAGSQISFSKASRGMLINVKYNTKNIGVALLK